MEKSPFKPGQLVRCVDNDPAWSGNRCSLDVGEVYTVSESLGRTSSIAPGSFNQRWPDTELIRIVGSDGKFSWRRFEKVDEPVLSSVVGLKWGRSA